MKRVSLEFHLFLLAYDKKVTFNFKLIATKVSAKTYDIYGRHLYRSISRVCYRKPSSFIRIIHAIAKQEKCKFAQT